MTIIKEFQLYSTGFSSVDVPRLTKFLGIRVKDGKVHLRCEVPGENLPVVFRRVKVVKCNWFVEDVFDEISSHLKEGLLLVGQQEVTENKDVRYDFLVFLDQTEYNADLDPVQRQN